MEKSWNWAFEFLWEPWFVCQLYEDKSLNLQLQLLHLHAFVLNDYCENKKQQFQVW